MPPEATGTVLDDPAAAGGDAGAAGKQDQQQDKTGDAADAAAAGADAGKQDGAAKTNGATAGTVIDEATQRRAAADGGGEPDWRRQMAGENASQEELNFLGRYNSQRAVLDALKAANKKISEGGQRTTMQPPGENAPEAEVKAWREANGIPETFENYEIKLSGERQIGEEDKPLLAHFAKAAHKAGMPASMLSTMVEAYYDLEAEEQSGLLEDDESYRDRTVRGLQDEWGLPDYRRNIGAVMHLFNGAGEKITIENPGPGEEKEIGIKEAILGARMPNGRKVGGDEQALRFLARIGLDLLPAGEDIPAGETKGALDDRLAELEKIMKEDPARWDATPSLWTEHQKLIDANLKRTKRAAG